MTNKNNLLNALLLCVPASWCVMFSYIFIYIYIIYFHVFGTPATWPYVDSDNNHQKKSHRRHGNIIRPKFLLLDTRPRGQPRHWTSAPCDVTVSSE